MKTVLVTGGAGYVGTHTIVELLNHNINVVVVDNLENSTLDGLYNVQKYTGKSVKFYQGDFSDKRLIDRIFDENKIDVVLHLAAYKSVGESVKFPEKYFNNNVEKFILLLKYMREKNVKNIIFPSSATTYKTDMDKLPYTEESELYATSPYAQNKIDCEKILNALYERDRTWNIVKFRYGNIIGANPEYNIGDNPTSNQTNLLQHIIRNCHDKNFKYTFCGNDFETKDGTGVRDYIHVKDIARMNCLACVKIEGQGLLALNVSNCKGKSVLELVHAFEDICGHKLNYSFSAKREGDVPIIIADNSKAKEFGFQPKYSFEQMLRDEFTYRQNIAQKELEK